MGDYTILKKIQMNCPVCDKLHEVEERQRITSMSIKGEEILYKEKYYYCSNGDEDEREFETGSMTNKNLLNARNAYRIRHKLLTSDEIIKIRESYGLSQVDLARLLGWGEATISRYESKAIQDEAYDMILRLVKDNPLQVWEFLKKNEDKFTIIKRQEIKEKILERLDSFGKEFLSRQIFEGEYVNFDVPSDSNGYALLDIEKTEVIISYFAGHILNLYKTKLMKLLWYADVLSFVQYGKAMTGLVYRHEAMGALPIGHHSLMALENVKFREEASDNFNYDSKFHIYENKQLSYSVLSPEEKSVLNTVISKFRSFNAADIIDYMHGESAYKKTSSGEVIPFSLAREIRPLKNKK